MRVLVVPTILLTAIITLGITIINRQGDSIALASKSPALCITKSITKKPTRGPASASIEKENIDKELASLEEEACQGSQNLGQLKKEVVNITSDLDKVAKAAALVARQKKNEVQYHPFASLSPMISLMAAGHNVFPTAAPEIRFSPGVVAHDDYYLLGSQNEASFQHSLKSNKSMSFNSNGDFTYSFFGPQEGTSQYLRDMHRSGINLNDASLSQPF